DLERKRRSLAAGHSRLAFEISGPKVKLEVAQLEQLFRQRGDLPGDQLGVQGDLEESELKLAALVAKRAAADAEGKSDVRYLQGEVGDHQPRRDEQRRESNERAPVEEPKLGGLFLGSPTRRLLIWNVVHALSPWVNGDFDGARSVTCRLSARNLLRNRSRGEQP